MNKPSKRIIETLQAFDRETILNAYKEHLKGSGGNTVGINYCPWYKVKTHGDYTVIGDRLIDTGRWICETEGIDIYEVYCPNMVYFADFTISFHGSWGEIHVFPDTGEVVGVDTDLGSGYENTESFGGYNHIKRVDMAEFRRWLGKVPTPDGKGHHLNRYFSWDILDVGFWTVYGDYEPADEYHRKLIVELIEVDLRDIEDGQSV